MVKWHPVVRELMDLIAAHKWDDAFRKAITRAHQSNVPELDDIRDLDSYLAWMNDLLYWVPTESRDGREINNVLSKFYFILDQPPVLGLQNHVTPHVKARPLTPLSAWMVQYATALGVFLDTPESLTDESLQTFTDSPAYNMGEYAVPHGGWKTFNQFFARNFKPGLRPIAAITDPSVIVSPADSTFAGQWEIRSDSEVTVKDLRWSIDELMQDSEYKDRFADGMFMHAFLNTTDYHRQHAPVSGTVLEARVIPGQVYMDVVAEPVPDDQFDRHRLKAHRRLDAHDDAGYQFAQARGLVVLDTAIGLVAVLPIGMCQVSSVVLTAEVGVTLRKGEEMSYFQFGGSDIVVLFESKSNVSFTAQPDNHYKMGTKIAEAFPVT